MLTRRGLMVNGAAAALVFSGGARAQSSGDALALHQRLICLDTHLDTPASLARPGWDIMQRHSMDSDMTQVDVPRMREGGLDGGFWAIYTPQGPLTPQAKMAARNAALLRAAEIREMVAAHPETFELAFEADDAAKIAARGKIIVFQSIENSYPLADDVSLLRGFYALGVRLVGPVHFKVNQFGDSATDKPHWNGLSPAGKELVALANDLGMVLDASHSADSVFDDMIELSRAPIICSHSGCRAVHDHPRNLDDARIKALAAKGGTIQINSYNDYLVSVPPNPERAKVVGPIYGKLENLSAMTPEQATAAVREAAATLKAMNAKYPQPRATFEDYMKHVTHALDLVGPDHVGVGCDWDGGGGVAGMEDVASLPRITERLLKLGYTEAQLANFWGGNALRALKAAETARKT
ncbi:MAG: membrane dipeptidase [Alphaproteobacteria bacterium]|nr:membrane dipeptidase [Alphaproteobacteria bacterium]